MLRKNMKKTILSCGSIIVIIMPIVAVVSCSCTQHNHGIVSKEHSRWWKISFKDEVNPNEEAGFSDYSEKINIA